jgi:hypothetical protein
VRPPLKERSPRPYARRLLFYSSTASSVAITSADMKLSTPPTPMAAMRRIPRMVSSEHMASCYGLSGMRDLQQDGSWDRFWSLLDLASGGYAAGSTLPLKSRSYRRFTGCTFATLREHRVRGSRLRADARARWWRYRAAIPDLGFCNTPHLRICAATISPCRISSESEPVRSVVH